MRATLSKQQKEQWSEEELQLLRELYPTFVSKKWKNISRVFQQKGFVRNEVQIREKWINFVDPSISSQKWTFEELQTIYNSYQKYGSRWSLAQKQLPTRTQNKIKNRFYGTLRNMIRMVVKKFDKNGYTFTIEISRICPVTLNELFDGEEEFAFMGNELPGLIRKMNYQLERKMFFERMALKEQKYRELYNTLLKVFKKYSRKEEERTERSSLKSIRHVRKESGTDSSKKEKEAVKSRDEEPDQGLLPNEPESEMSGQDISEGEHYSMVLNQARTDDICQFVPVYPKSYGQERVPVSFNPEMVALMSQLQDLQNAYNLARHPFF